MYTASQYSLLVSFISVIMHHFNKRRQNPVGSIAGFIISPNGWKSMKSMLDDLTFHLQILAAVPMPHFYTSPPWQADISAGLH